MHRRHIEFTAGFLISGARSRTSGNDRDRPLRSGHQSAWCV
jgi:hypothetical protein